MLESSDRGGIRIQYSKNPYGKKRDVTGNYISTPIPGYGEEAAAAPQDPSAPGVETKPGMSGSIASCAFALCCMSACSLTGTSTDMYWGCRRSLTALAHSR